MKLFLSSENFGKYPDEFVRLVNGRKLAYIGNAKDYNSPSERSAKVEEHQIQFASLGIDFTEIDLRDYFENNTKLQSDMSNFGAVWCSGGNTFLLRSAFQQSGLDKILVEKIRNEDFIYGGSSAGAILAGPTLKGTENGDNPELVPEIYKKDICWLGLGLVDFVVVPHYESVWFGDKSVKMINHLKENNIPYKILIDGQVILIDGVKEKFLS